jgi:hypothetical protein
LATSRVKPGAGDGLGGIVLAAIEEVVEEATNKSASITHQSLSKNVCEHSRAALA